MTIVSYNNVAPPIIEVPVIMAKRFRIAKLTADNGTYNVIAEVQFRPNVGVPINHVGRGDVASASSSAYGLVPANAIDGNPSTEWHSDGSGNGVQWLEITSTIAVSVRSVNLQCVNTSAAAAVLPRKFTLQRYDETIPAWIDIKEFDGPSYTAGESREYVV